MTTLPQSYLYSLHSTVYSRHKLILIFQRIQNRTRYGYKAINIACNHVSSKFHRKHILRYFVRAFVRMHFLCFQHRTHFLIKLSMLYTRYTGSDLYFKHTTYTRMGIRIASKTLISEIVCCQHRTDAKWVLAEWKRPVNIYSSEYCVRCACAVSWSSFVRHRVFTLYWRQFSLDASILQELDSPLAIERRKLYDAKKTK